ncbi:hypothetical protein CLOP_g9608 [Closterium sp. NIES-67]|nr:hypothetical protein CLOP_g9608 [Closterium sp. NIES-67]
MCHGVGAYAAATRTEWTQQGRAALTRRPNCVIVVETAPEPLHYQHVVGSSPSASSAASGASSPATSPSGVGSWRPGAVPVSVRSPNAAVVRRRAYSSLDMDLEWGTPPADSESESPSLAAPRSASMASPSQTGFAGSTRDLRQRRSMSFNDQRAAPVSCFASPTKSKCPANRRVTFNPLVRVRPIPPRLAAANLMEACASVADSAPVSPPLRAGTASAPIPPPHSPSRRVIAHQIPNECPKLSRSRSTEPCGCRAASLGGSTGSYQEGRHLHAM